MIQGRDVHLEPEQQNPAFSLLYCCSRSQPAVEQPPLQLYARQPRFWEPAPGTSPVFSLLVTDQALPKYLHNPFIQTHYRAHLTLSMCARSIFMIHNETVNIWSHLLPALGFLAYLLQQATEGKATPPLLACCLANTCVFLVSTFAHAFSPINISWHRRCWAADWSAIAFAIFGNFYPVCYYGFSDRAREQQVLGALLGVSCGAILVMANTSQWTKMPIHLKSLVALSPLPVGIVILIRLATVLSPEKCATILKPLVPLLVVIACGLSVYAARVPERWFPGCFDLIGNSHNFHHLWTTSVAVLSVINIRHWEELLRE